MDHVDGEAGQVSDFWGDERKGLRQHNWMEHPVSRTCMNLRISGDPTMGSAQHWQRTFLQVPAKLGLSLGCGFGTFDRTAVSMGLVERMEASDLSEGAVAQARAYAAEQGLSDRISYTVCDLDHAALPAGRYDVAFGISSIHHVSKLAWLFHQLRRTLKPDGLLFMDEYVGSTKFQSKPHVLAMIRRFLQILPARYRRDVFADGRVREEHFNIGLEWFETFDPSEAVRSEEIMNELAVAFEVVEVRPYGGAILHTLLSGIAGNFDPADEADATVLRMLAAFEEMMEQHGVFTSDFAAIVARPRAV